MDNSTLSQPYNANYKYYSKSQGKTQIECARQKLSDGTLIEMIYDPLKRRGEFLVLSKKWTNYKGE